MNSQEKQAFANEAEKAIRHPVVQEAVDELMVNLNIPKNRQGLPRYGLMKVALYAATVARAHALGIDPEMLRLGDDEGREETAARITSFLDAGKPVIVVQRDTEADHAER